MSIFLSHRASFSGNNVNFVYLFRWHAFITNNMLSAIFKTRPSFYLEKRIL